MKNRDEQEILLTEKFDAEILQKLLNNSWECSEFGLQECYFEGSKI